MEGKLTLRVLALSLLVISVACGGFVYSLSQERTLRMTRVYLAFCAVLGSIQLTFRPLWPVTYCHEYWTFEVAHNLVLCFLSAEIIRRLLARRSAIRWIGIAVTIPLATVLVRLPLNPVTALRNVSTAADFVGGLMLLALFFISPSWTTEYRIATSGVIAILVGDLLSLFEISGHSGGRGLISAVQLAPVLGLILLSLAGRFKSKDKPTHRRHSTLRELPQNRARSGHAA